MATEQQQPMSDARLEDGGDMTFVCDGSCDTCDMECFVSNRGYDGMRDRTAMLCMYPGCDAIAEIIQGKRIPAGSHGRKRLFCSEHSASERSGGDGA